MPNKTTRSGVGEAWLAQREPLWNPRPHTGVAKAPLCNQ
jgi:hypothetical protein